MIFDQTKFLSVFQQLMAAGFPTIEKLEKVNSLYKQRVDSFIELYDSKDSPFLHKYSILDKELRALYFQTKDPDSAIGFINLLFINICSAKKTEFSKHSRMLLYDGITTRLESFNFPATMEFCLWLSKSDSFNLTEK